MDNFFETQPVFDYRAGAKELLEEILPIIQDYFDMVANQTENRAMLHLKNGQLFVLALNER